MDVVFNLYSSFLLQTCFIVFVTYFLHLKHPNKFIFNVINIYIGHLLTTLFCSCVIKNIFEVQKRKGQICKDELARVSVFEAAGHLLGCPTTTSFCKKRDELFFVDYSIMPLFIHMNYPASILNGHHQRDGT